MFKKKNFLLIMLLIFGLSLTACGSEDVDPKTDAPAVEDDTTGDDSEDIVLSDDEYKNIEIKAEEVFDIFIGEYPDAKVKEVKLETKSNKYIYSIEGYADNKEYELELKIDPLTGNILDVKSEVDLDDEGEHTEITRANLEKVTELVDEALASSGADSLLEEWTVEVDDGIIKLDIEIDKKGLDDIEYTYNLETGDLLELDD